jgi:mannosyltransferase OCH1-like enzyme
MKSAIDSTMAASPEFDQYMYSDEDCLKFLEENFEPNVAKAFRSLKPGAYQSDFWRACILYKKGGVYIDIKLAVKIPVKEILEDPAPILVKDLLSSCSSTKGFWNGVMAAPPGHPFFKAAIDAIVENCKTQNYGENSLSITGPCLLGKLADPGTYDRQNLEFKVEADTNRIYFKGREFSEEYKGYRNDQATLQKTPRYGEMWHARTVFDGSVKFD